MNDIEDIKRIYRDRRRVGALSKEIPLQSALALLLDSKADDYEQRRNLNSFSFIDPTLQISQSQNLPILSINSNKLVSSVLEQLPHRCKAFPESYQQILDSVMAIPSSDPSATENRLKMASLSSIDLSHEEISKDKSIPRRNETLGNGLLNTAGNGVQNNHERRNPFESAKMQFVKEGGKIESIISSATKQKKPITSSSTNDNSSDDKSDLPPELQQYEKHLVEKIESDIIHTGHPVRFEDVAGLDFAKKTVQEIIVWPMTRPDLFIGLRAVPRGLLLFGPPGLSFFKMSSAFITF